jgi:hypothetical protein
MARARTGRHAVAADRDLVWIEASCGCKESKIGAAIARTLKALQFLVNCAEPVNDLRHSPPMALQPALQRRSRYIYRHTGAAALWCFRHSGLSAMSAFATRAIPRERRFIRDAAFPGRSAARSSCEAVRCRAGAVTELISSCAGLTRASIVFVRLFQEDGWPGQARP